MVQGLRSQMPSFGHLRGSQGPKAATARCMQRVYWEGVPCRLLQVHEVGGGPSLIMTLGCQRRVGQPVVLHLVNLELIAWYPKP